MRFNEGEHQADFKTNLRRPTNSFNVFDCGGQSLNGWDKLMRAPGVILFPIALTSELFYLGIEAYRQHFIQKDR